MTVTIHKCDFCKKKIDSVSKKEIKIYFKYDSIEKLLELCDKCYSTMLVKCEVKPDEFYGK